MYDYDRRASDRPKHPDGRLIPQLGDEVYQMVAGAFGMGAVIEGVVIKGRGALRVKVTGGGGPLGISQAPVGRTFQLTPAWTVKDDPAVKAKQEAQEREKLEKQTREQALKEAGAKAIEEKAKSLGLHRVTGMHEVKVGDEVYSLESQAERFGKGDPHDVAVSKVTVTGLGKNWFLYKTHEGHEVTSGKPELWWKKH
jgi:hypothetical protein